MEKKAAFQEKRGLFVGVFLEGEPIGKGRKPQEKLMGSSQKSVRESVGTWLAKSIGQPRNGQFVSAVLANGLGKRRPQAGTRPYALADTFQTDFLMRLPYLSRAVFDNSCPQISA